MSRLTDLLAQARKADPQLAADLEAEFRQLTGRSQFGLVFERHQPEAVELPGRPVRRGDTVRVLPPRGSLTIGDTRHWVVTDLERTPDGKQAHLTEADVDPEVREPATSTAALEDLVVVARFEDPIYPGLVETGRVERGGDKPFHTVINAENFHALEMLTYTHRHQVDCIYIDPPYNTGAKDWKYNNDYVESDDDYRHSKWLSFMERRLLVAKELLSPEDSVLIVTIDEKEYLRLGMLLEQTFPEAHMTMVTSSINNAGASRAGTFGRAAEYIYFLRFGESRAIPLPLSEEWNPVGRKSKHDLLWNPLIRTGTNTLRSDSPNQFYPVFASLGDNGPVFHSVGESYFGSDYSEVAAPEGTVAIWPIRSNGAEGNWQISAPNLRHLIAEGHARLGRWRGNQTTLYYLKRGERAKIESGQFPVSGRRSDGSVITDSNGYEATFIPTDVWRIKAHDAGHHGSSIIRALIPAHQFTFPKSLYAVEDALRFFVKNKPGAVILDFFSGSGTTAHAVMRLNKQDGGRRQCISVTNNEVSAEEQKGLRAKGLRPGDAEWEQWGICDYITKPRITAAITGKTPAGDPIKGEYKFTDEFPMADGFEENAAFFTLTYEAPRQVRRNRAFSRVAPMLWLKAGSRGRIISSLPERGWDVAQAYGVLEDMDHAPEFLAALEADSQVGMAFIVTDSEVAFQSVARQLPEHTIAVRLYESYLHNFQINRRA